MGGSITLSGVSNRILVVRGVRVLLSSDLASMYGVEERVLVQATKRNHQRFPSDFMFQLNTAEASNLRSQIVISSSGHGGRRYRPYAFTEQGVAMLSSVLRSKRAITVNIEIMRAFVRLRRWLISNKDLATRIAELEKAVDGRFTIVFEALDQLTHPSKPRRPIGFKTRT